MTRTDVHSPKNLKTEDYEYLGSYQDHPSEGEIFFDARPKTELIRAVVVDAGRRFAGIHSSGQCDHCGAVINYTALLLHTPTNTVLTVGETCLENRFELATAEFQALRKAAKLSRERQAALAAAEAWIAKGNEDLAFMVTGEFPYGLDTDAFVTDVARRFRQYGGMSDRQAAAIRKAVARAAERAAQPKVEEPKDVRIPEVGKVTIEGALVHVEWKDNPYGPGGSLKGLVIVPTKGGQYRVWTTVPAASEARQGDTVRLTGTLSRSDRDESFGFLARPRVAK